MMSAHERHAPGVDPALSPEGAERWAATSARMPARIGSGKVGHARMIAARSGSAGAASWGLPSAP